MNHADTVSTAYIALGANLGDAQATLRAVFDEIAQLPQTTLVKKSSLYRSPPFGANADGPDYINAVAELTTALTPHQLLDALQHIERSHGRERTHQNAPRTLDLDILLYDDIVLHDERLTVPHPRMQERAFVLRPLAEISPDLVWQNAAHQNQFLQKLLPNIASQTCEKIA
ncbi:MAG: 2-amino-4-hydroxy-6-hydroxymethyldihydropteridine diphosphokinase [Formosimonas sp.]